MRHLVLPRPTPRHLIKVVQHRIRAALGKREVHLPPRYWPFAVGGEAALSVTSCPRDPAGLPPLVRNLPPGDIADFVVQIVSRYEATMLLYPAVAALDALRDPCWRQTTDVEFVSLLTDSAYSRFLTPTLDPADHRFFAPLSERPGDDFMKVDFSAMALCTPLPGLHTAPTVTLLRQAQGAPPQAVAIRLGDLLVTPADVHTWPLAKLFVLQGAAHHLIMVVHPRIHFPLDPINAITRLRLPPHHLLRRLLEPHLRFSLALNLSVREHPRSIARNRREELYTPFVWDEASTWRLVSAGYRGLPGNSAYPPYRFPLGPLPIPAAYGTFLAGYHNVLLRFVERVLSQVSPDDPQVRAWADEIAAWVPGFPDGTAILRDGNLPAAVASFICQVSVGHSADHHDYGHSDIRRSPLRLRLAPPTAPLREPVDPRALLRPSDLFRYRMAWRMFFLPSTLRRLSDTRYRFDPVAEPDLLAARQGLGQALGDWDAHLPCRRYAPLSAISQSIEY